MRTIKLGLLLICIVLCLVVTLFLRDSQLAAAQEGSMKGFLVQEVRFDEIVGGKRPIPRIPRGWRFVGVSNGEKMNVNNLWFRDGSGNIYLIKGFTSSGSFILDEKVQKINAGR